MPIAIVGAAATFVAILRPLADAAPVIAGVGVVLVLASWLASRRR